MSKTEREDHESHETLRLPIAELFAKEETYIRH